MSNDAGFARLDDWIRRLRGAGEVVPEMAQMVADKLGEEAKAAQSEQRSMSGEKWPPTEAGTPALRNVASNLTTRAIGTTAIITLRGHHVYHQFGAGVPRRAILPTGGMPQKLGNAIRVGIIDMGVAWMTRKGRGKRR